MTTMTIPQVSSEIKKLFDESVTILAKTGGAITEATSNEDRARLAENKSSILGFEAQRDQLKAAESDTSFFKDGQQAYGRPAEQHRQPSSLAAYRRSVGHGVVGSEAYKSARDGGLFSASRPQWSIDLPPDISLMAEAKAAGGWMRKALVTSASGSAGELVLDDRLAGIVPLTRGELGFLDVLPTLATTSDLVEWISQESRTNNAAPVAEATATTGTSGLKPESALAYSVMSKPVETIATWVPVTTRILQDAPMLRSAIDDELLYMVREELEEQAITGNGTSPNLLGLNNWPGIPTMAAGANVADSIFNAAMAVRFTGGVQATIAVVNPTTLGTLRLMRENAASGTLGSYLFGPPNMPGPMTVFGLQVIPAQACPASTAFVMNATATTLALVEREGANISTGWIDQQFVRNIITLLAELRALLIVRRPKGIVKLTGVA